MITKPTSAGQPEPSLPPAPALGLGDPARRAERKTAFHSPAEVNLRRLRYFIELLETGFRHALRPDPLARSLRAERIALGIDVPELDAVPLWSTCREDRTVSIPFVEFIASEVLRSLDAFIRDLETAAPEAAEPLRLGRRALRRSLEKAGLRAGDAPALPRLGDIFLAQEALAEVCGPKGVLRAIVTNCEEALLAAAAG